jgi:cyanophycin synthetase
MDDFKISKFYTYRGPNYYLNRQALVFNLSLDPEGRPAEFYNDRVVKKFPSIGESCPDRVGELFAQALVNVLKMDIGLFINRWSVSRDGKDHVIAVEYLDGRIAEDAALFVAEWFRAMNAEKDFDFDGGFIALQDEFNKTLFGGPTIYSLVEGGLKRDIPIFFLHEESQFQWGYGRKQLRGRSTTVHTDGIKDTEFTTYKDVVKDFLLLCGFPTPSGKNCFAEDEAVEEAHRQTYPVVLKPLAGHKGQGVTTNIEDDEGVRRAFNRIVASAKAEGVSFDGAIVENQVYGTDHRLLSVGGKFVAALERIPAYIDGDGRETIEALIAIENDKEVRLDNARSPLCKITIDDDLKEYLDLQNITLASVPKEGERIFLRRVANISAGGVSINVTDKIHPRNVKLVEDIAKFFNVTFLGIDVLAGDIAKPWDEDDFSIIEINAGPGVFMHLAPAIGGSIDVPGVFLKNHFKKEKGERIPIIAGNRLTADFAAAVHARLEELSPGIEFGSLTEEGVFFNGARFFKNEHHDDNVKIMLRNPQLGFALFNHTADNINDYGMLHQGADVVILEDPDGSEDILDRDLLEGGALVRITGDTFTVTCRDETIECGPFGNDAEKNGALLEALDKTLQELVEKY